MQDNSASITERRQQQKQWDKDAERLILYADFMGFKSRIFNTEHAVLKNELLEFHSKWMGTCKQFNFLILFLLLLTVSMKSISTYSLKQLFALCMLL